MNQKQTFGLIMTTRSFFPSHLVATAREKMVSKLHSMGYNVVTLTENDTQYGAVVTYEEACKCAELFKAHRDEISGIIVVLPNFGEETGVADAIVMADLNVPILIQACDDDFDKLGLDNRRDAFCGKLSLCNNLYQRDIKYTLTTLHTCAIECEELTRDIENFAAVCRVVNGLRGLRIAALGARPNAFHTVRFSEKLLQRSGITVCTIDLSEIIFAAMKMPTDQKVLDKIAEIRAYGKVAPGISDEKVEKQAKLCIAIEECVDANHCQASAIQCWDSVQNNYGCATCLAMSMMGEKGKPSACEMDITGTLTMYAMYLASGTPSAYMDWNNNVRDNRSQCICLHCSNFPASFFGNTPEIENLDVLATTIGAEKCFGACKGQVGASPMTFAKITTDDKNGKIKCYVGEGRFLPDEIPTKGGVAYCEVEDLQGMMHHICNNGFEHHVAFNKSNISDVLEEALGKYMGFEVYHHGKN